ncbi:MAG TPA: hypothetical protein VGH24_12000 [Solirubrobacteraceae bacterium]
MRRILLLGFVGALVFAGVAYAAVTNIYVVNSKVAPTKSGTKKNPKPVSVQIEYSVGTSPSGQRPAVVAGYKTLIAGLQENTTFFPGCSTSTLQSKGPSKCPKGSQIGSAAINALAGPSSNSSTSYSFPCKFSVPIFNGGQHNLILYLAKSNAGPCATSHAGTIVVNLKNGSSLAFTYSIPTSFRHPSAGTDLAITKNVINFSNKTVKHNGKQVGLLATISCAPNKQRQVKDTFTTEGGVSKNVTDLVKCT